MSSGVLLLWRHQRCAVISRLSAAAAPRCGDSRLSRPARLTQQCFPWSRGGESETGDACPPRDLVCLGGTWGEKLECVEVLTCPGRRGEPGWQFNVLRGDPLMGTRYACQSVATVSNWILPSRRLTGGPLGCNQHCLASGHFLRASLWGTGEGSLMVICLVEAGLGILIRPSTQVVQF